MRIQLQLMTVDGRRIEWKMVWGFVVFNLNSTNVMHNGKCVCVCACVLMFLFLKSFYSCISIRTIRFTKCAENIICKYNNFKWNRGNTFGFRELENQQHVCIGACVSVWVCQCNDFRQIAAFVAVFFFFFLFIYSFWINIHTTAVPRNEWNNFPFELFHLALTLELL